jgi:phenylacetate-CoA ligase
MTEFSQIEYMPWKSQIDADDESYRTQISYLFDRSEFYRKKLADAGFSTPQSVGGLRDIAQLPLTEKDELRETRDETHPIGTHLAASMEDIIRIYSTSGTTGLPSYIPLTADDLETWITISRRSYGASGVQPGEWIVSTFNAGPFVAAVALDTFARLGLCHIPVGAGNTERLMTAIQQLKPSVLACTPSYALHLAEWAEKRGIELAGSSVKRILVAGEPGGGEPALRAHLEKAWGAKVTEAMGIGDVSVSLWGECEHRTGMHFSGRGLVHFELVDPATGAPVPIEEGAEGELVYTHLNRQAVPLLRFRSRDHARVSTSSCPCGRTAPRVRCIGRTDDMLIVRGVNVFPTAIREVVGEFEPHISGVILIRPQTKGVKQSPPLPLIVELAEGARPPGDLAEQIRKRIRDKLIVTTEIQLAEHGSLPRTDYKSKLVDWSHADK